MDPMLGMIYIIPFNWAPSGYVICQGQLVNIQQYAALYSLIGTAYGGNGSSNFGLPNLQGRAPIGYGTAPSGTNYPLASVTGTEKETLTVPNLPPHNHAATFTPTTGSQAITIPATSGNLQVGVTVNATTSASANAVPSSTNNMLSATPATQKLYGPTQTAGLVPLSGTSASVTGNPTIPSSTVNITTVTGGSVAVAATGSGVPVNNMQPSLALNFIIAMTGIYPSRP